MRARVREPSAKRILSNLDQPLHVARLGRREREIPAARSSGMSGEIAQMKVERLDAELLRGDLGVIEIPIVTHNRGDHVPPPARVRGNSRGERTNVALLIRSPPSE